MKTKKGIFKWIIFTCIVGYCAITFTPTFNKNKASLTMDNIEALAEWQWEDVLKYCTSGRGWCIINNIEYYGVVYAGD